MGATGHLRLLTGAALSGGAALGGIFALGLKRTVDQYEDARKVGLSTNAVITSTGGVANVTRREVDALSTSLSRKAGIDDEAIARGENMLLTFRHVRNEVGKGNDIFNQATRAVVDLSAGMTAMGKPMSVSSASVLLGKALNDPARGAAALGRTGAIDKAAVERIKQMQKQGASLRTLQKFVLGQVNAQFGGQAAATATPLAKLKAGIENVEESIGKGLSPATDAFAVKLGRLADDAAPKFDRLGTRLEHIMDRKDLDFTHKLGLSTTALSHTLRPYERQLGRELKKMHLGDKLADGIELAVPKLADAAANAAPKAAEAFLHGWLHAGIWGKLLTVGMLEKKTGIIGGLLGGRLGGGMGVRGPVGAGSLANPIAVISEGGGGGLPLLGRGKAGGLLGRLLGSPLVRGGAAATAFLYGTGLLNPDTAGQSPKDERRGLRRAHGRSEYFRTAEADFFKRKPWARKFQNQYLDMAQDLGRMRDGTIHAPARDQRYLARRVGQMRSYLRSIGDPHVLPIPGNAAAARRLNVNVYLDGKGIAHQLTVTQGKQLERGVRRAQADKDARR